jgi:hypothetical protein
VDTSFLINSLGKSEVPSLFITLYNSFPPLPLDHFVLIYIQNIYYILENLKLFPSLNIKGDFEFLRLDTNSFQNVDLYRPLLKEGYSWLDNKYFPALISNNQIFEILNSKYLSENLNTTTYFINDIHFNYTHWVDLYETFKSTEILGFLLYNIYFMYLILGSFILLIAMIGSIFLTLSERKDKKFQKLDKQIFTDIYNSIFLNR